MILKSSTMDTIGNQNVIESLRGHCGLENTREWCQRLCSKPFPPKILYSTELIQHGDKHFFLGSQGSQKSYPDTLFLGMLIENEFLSIKQLKRPSIQKSFLSTRERRKNSPYLPISRINPKQRESLLDQEKKESQRSRPRR